MIEIRTFEGDARELARFASPVWQATYAGRRPVPDWTERYYDWQLLANSSADPSYRVAAYDGTRLVGTLLAENFDFQWQGRKVLGSMASWLTVDPNYRRDGVASLLAEEQRGRHLEREAEFCLGFGISRTSGPLFWERMPDTRVLGRVRLWVRILNPKAFCRWTYSPGHRMGVGAFRELPLFKAPRPPRRREIRPFRSSDLASCLGLCRQSNQTSDLSYLWTEARLGHQLEYRGMPSTLVFDSERGEDSEPRDPSEPVEDPGRRSDSRGGGRSRGSVRGFVNSYLLDLLGREPIRSQIVDLVAFDETLSGRDRLHLLRESLAQAASAGAAISLSLQKPSVSKRTMLAAGFFPMPSEFSLIFAFVDPQRLYSPVRRIYVQWR